MQWPSRFPKFNTVLIILFFCMWFYTEVEENRTRVHDEQAAVEWKAFIRAGGRFTSDDGEALRVRIEHLEKHVDDIH